MDNDERDQIPQNDEEEKSPSDNAGNVSSKVEKVGKKAVGAIRGAAAAGEGVEAGVATAEGVAAGEVTTGEAAAGVATTEGAIGAGIEAATAGAAVAEGATAGVGATVATTGSSLGMWALGATLIAVFIITFVAVLFKGGATVNAGIPSPTLPPGGGTISGPVPACVDIDAALSRDLNATVQAGSVGGWVCGTGCGGIANPPPETPDCPTKQKFWRLWAHLTLSPNFAARLTSIPYRAELFRDNTINSFGYTAWPFKTQLLNVIELFSSGNYTTIAFWITHETTHMLQKRDTSLEQRWDVNYFKNNGDSNCYAGVNKNYIKTYGAIDWAGTSPTRESMAEATALYVYNSKVTSYARINNFKIECPATYNWIHTNLFPDYEFN